MPVKQVVCCVCGETVNKAQTLAVGDNQRACRKHPTTTQKSQKLLDGEKQLRKEEQEKVAQKKERKSLSYNLKPRCACCEKEGLHRRNFYTEMLLCSHRYEAIHGPYNIFDAEIMKKVYHSMQGMKCLNHVKFSKKTRIKKHLVGICQTLGFTLLCNECCKEQNIPIVTGAENITFEQLVNFSAIYESTVKPCMEAVISEESRMN